MNAPRVPALPPALAPWAELFSEMPEPDQRMVAGLVEAVRPLLERIDGAGSRPQGEIDGLGGLGTRGGIERLVASEWLWRDLDADAFLQRAAARELLTFEPAYRQSAEVGAVMVVIDTGPDLIGAPRLVAFAALLCLGGLALRRGARLLWACSAAPSSRGWCEGLAPADAALLLKETAAVPLAGAELDRLLALPAALREASRSGGSLWLVGGGPLPEAERPARRIAIAERPRLDEAGLSVAAEVTVAGPRGMVSAARLDLPSEPEAVALLRGPFRPRPAPGGLPVPARPPRPPAPSGWAPSGLALSPSGEYLLASVRGGLVVLPTLGPSAGVFLSMARHQRLVGIDVWPGRIRAAFVTVYSDWTRILVQGGAFGGGQMQTRLDLRAPRDHPLGRSRHPAAALPPLGVLKRRDRYWLCAADGAPFLLAEEGASPYSALQGATLLAVSPAALVARDRTGEIVAHHRGDARLLVRFPAGAAPPGEVRRLEVVVSPTGYVLAAEREDGAWGLTEAASGEACCVHPQRRIVGFAAFDPRRAGITPDKPAAVHLDGPDGTLTFRGLDGADLIDPIALPDASLGTVRVAAHPRAGAVIAAARLDADGFVEALALRTLAADWRYLPDVAAFAEEAACLRA